MRAMVEDDEETAMDEMAVIGRLRKAVESMEDSEEILQTKIISPMAGQRSLGALGRMGLRRCKKRNQFYAGRKRSIGRSWKRRRKRAR